MAARLIPENSEDPGGVPKGKKARPLGNKDETISAPTNPAPRQDFLRYALEPADIYDHFQLSQGVFW
jgi:hypothetical protein